MKSLLTGGLCSWPSDRVQVLEDVAAWPEMATRLVELTEGVEDVLLIYYVGHGMRVPNGQLALALRDTSSNRALLRHTAMAYKDVAEILRDCPAATKLVILDCCHAELGNRATYQFQSADIDAEPVDGLYCIWASKEWEKAKSPLSGGLTYFTDAFIGVVQAGIPGKPSQLTIYQVFTELRARLLRANLPEPAQSGIRDAHHWPFAINAAQPETHRHPDQEIALLLEWKAAAEAREEALQAQVAEHARELERLRALASSAGHMTAQERDGLQSAISATERLLDDSVAAKAVGAASSPDGAKSGAASADSAGGGKQSSDTASAGSTSATTVPGVLTGGALLGQSTGTNTGTGPTPARDGPAAGTTAPVPGAPAVSGTASASPAGRSAKGIAVIPAASPTPAAATAQPAASGNGKSSASAAAGKSSSSTEQQTTAATSPQQAFISSVTPGAVAAQQRYGVPAAVTIAQAIEESGWGGSELAAKYHNLFGIKGTGPAGSVTLPTSEYLNGQWVAVDAQFRVYHNDAESISDHAELLATSGYYTRAMADRAVPDAFANDLTGVYATDPGYGANLIALMKLYDLYRFDTASTPAPATPTATPRASARPSASPTAAGTASPAAGTGQAARLVWSDQAGSAGATRAKVPGLAMPRLAPSAGSATSGAAATAASGNAHIPGLGAGVTGSRTTGVGQVRVPATGTSRYESQLPTAVVTAFFARAKGPLVHGEHLYRDVAASMGISWKLLAAVDWMQCKADPRYSPVNGERLGSANADGTSFDTKSAALAHCASELQDLAAAVYGINLTDRRRLSIRDLAAAFAAFRWGSALARHSVSAMEFPYSVAGLTAAHQKMHWPRIDALDVPDRPGARYREPFGAVPVVISLGYPAIV